MKVFHGYFVVVSGYSRSHNLNNAVGYRSYSTHGSCEYSSHIAFAKKSHACFHSSLRKAIQNWPQQGRPLTLPNQDGRRLPYSDEAETFSKRRRLLLFCNATERKRFMSAINVSSTNLPMKSLLLMMLAMDCGTSNSTAKVTVQLCWPLPLNSTFPRFDSPLSLFHAIISPLFTAVFPVVQQR